MITWHSDLPPQPVLEQTERELEEMLREDLDQAEDLIFHTIIVDDRPVVCAWGVKGDNNFHAEYDPDASWVSV